MKKVVCVSDDRQDETGPKVVKGKLYTVYDLWEKPGCPLYYYLVGMPGNWVFKADMFIDVIEDQQDETCFVRDYNKEKV